VENWHRLYRNNLYAIGPGETIEFNVWVRTIGETPGDFDLKVSAVSETNSQKRGEAGLSVISNVTASAYVVKESGNTNDLYITATEFYIDGTSIEFTTMFVIDNNAADYYPMDTASGVYTVYVDTKGNIQIRACEIVDFR